MTEHSAGKSTAGGSSRGRPLPDDLANLAGGVQTRVAHELARTLSPDRLLRPTSHDEAQVWDAIAKALAVAERKRVLAGHPPLAAQEREEVGRQVYDALLRLGPWQRYLSDPEVEEVIINGHTSAFVVRTDGRKHQILTGFDSEAELHAFAARTVAAAGRRLDEASPSVDVSLPDGSRLSVVCPPLAPCTYITIRCHRLADRSLADLVKLGTLTPPVAELLAAAVRAGLNVLVSGGTASGKTTMLNALAAEIPGEVHSGERVITIEETRELDLRRLPDSPTLEARFGNVEGVGVVTQRKLVHDALRMRPTRIIVGEVRGPEALDMLVAMNSGHDGSMGTIHANTAREALAKLRLLTMWAETGLSSGVVTEMIADTLNLVCQLRRERNGGRVLAELVEVVGVEREQILTNSLVTLDQHRRPALTGLRPHCAERLTAEGWPLVDWAPAKAGEQW